MYEKMYHILFRAVSDAMDLIEAHKNQEALTVLEIASKEAEDLYIEQ